MLYNPHVELLHKGVTHWNNWKKKHPGTKAILQDVDFSGADLSGIDLSRSWISGKFNGANLQDSDLSNTRISGFSEFASADFSRANLSKVHFDYGIVARPERSIFGRWAETRIPCDLKEAKFNDSILFEANLRYQCLEGADFSGAQLNYACLSNSILDGANFFKARLLATEFVESRLFDANFTEAVMGEVTFAGANLRFVRGLDTVTHKAPSHIGLETIYRSKGKISAHFLRSCGMPESFIAFMPSLFESEAGIQFHSCFITYSSKDELFALRLYSGLRDAGLKVWYAAKDMKGGQKLHEQIENAINMYDKLIVVLSEHSLQSEWVKTEIRTAHRIEQETGTRKLFPILLDDISIVRRWSCFDSDSGKDLGVELREFYMLDFRGWENKEKLESAVKLLVRDLQLAESPVS